MKIMLRLKVDGVLQQMRKDNQSSIHNIEQNFVPLSSLQIGRVKLPNVDTNSNTYLRKQKESIKSNP